MAEAATIPVGQVSLDADLAVPATPHGVVLFAHGSGSSRHSPRNRTVAAALQEAGWATLLVDLLTAEEERVDLRTAELRFDIGLLAQRLVGAIDWLAGEDRLRGSPVVTFGASTGAAAALLAAAQRPDRVRAVISRGGRPDLADAVLPQVAAPTLLIVGGNDPTVLRLNEDAARRLPGEVELEVVPGATHLFEEPGALDRVVELVLRALDRWL